MKKQIAFVVLALASAVLPAGANDGFMGLPAGGLTLQKSADIAMLEEDLFISADEIRVNYVFQNYSRAPVTAQVGFPMPGLPASINFDAETGYDMHDVKGLDVLKFETKIEGRPVTTTPIVRAFYYPKQKPWEEQDRFRFTDAKDITAELTAAGIPLTFDANAIRAAYARLPASKKADWTRRSIYFKESGYEAPNWLLSTVFVREQTFPARTNVRVQHKYKPYPSGFIMVANQLNQDKELVKSTCIDAQTKNAVNRIITPETGGVGTVIDYILTTANTWKGPIGTFKMTVDKGKPQYVVSFCANGVRKIGPTQFAVTYRNFKPEKDIKVLIVRGPEN